MLKILKYGLIGWIVLSIVTLPLYWPFARMVWVFMPFIPQASYDAPTSPLEARLQDIDYLSTLTKYDRAFSAEAAAAFEGRIAQMRERAPEMSDAAFYLAIAEAVALADNGHSGVSTSPQFRAFQTIGARFYGFEDGLHIVSAAPAHADTLGDRVLALNGQPIADVQARLAAYRGGNEPWRTLYSTYLMEAPALLAAAGLGPAPDHVMLTLENADGAVRDVRFDALSPDTPDDIPWRSAWQALVPNEGSPGFTGWPHVFSGDEARLPAYLTNTAQPMSRPLAGNGLYVRALPGFEAGDQSIKAAYREMLSAHADGSLDYMVVDFRLHDGGDYTKSMDFAKSAPNKVKADGDLYIVTGPNTFSAAIVTVAMLKYHAGDRGLIIGEPMGDREQFWAERGSSFQLPNTGYYINYATAYHDWENGCKGEPYCYTMNERNEVPAGSLAPAVQLSQSFAGYQAGEDVALGWIAARQAGL